MRHDLWDDLKRFDLNILEKDDANFSSFRNALDSRMKEMTSVGIGTTKNVAYPLTLADEELYVVAVRHYWLLKILIYYISRP